MEAQVKMEEPLLSLIHWSLIYKRIIDFQIGEGYGRHHEQ
jgi:hypothetical protein